MPTCLPLCSWSCPFEMEFPYPAIAPSTNWWPSSTFPTAGQAEQEGQQKHAAVRIQPLDSTTAVKASALGQREGSATATGLAAENAALKARVAELEAQLAELAAN